MGFWNKLLGRKQAPRQQPPPLDLGWQELGALDVISGKLWVGDAQFAALETEGVVVELQPGDYRARIHWLDFQNDRRASHFLLAMNGSTPQRGDQLGETWADTASQAACDFEVYRLVSEPYEKYWERAEPFLTTGEPGRYVHDELSNAVLIHTPSGWGDGTFKLFELVENGERCGIEVEMIDLDDPYPSV